MLKTSGAELTWDGRTIAVAPALEARFRMEPRLGTAPLTVQLTDESVGDVGSRLWEFGDGSTSDVATPRHTYRDAGRYEVRLTVTGGCPDAAEDRATVTDTVIVGSLPAVELVQAGPRCVAMVLTN